MMRLLNAILLICMLLTILQCNGHTNNDIKASSDKIILSENDEIHVKIFIVSRKGQPCMAASSWRWGAENSCPNEYISSLEINVRGEAVFVPMSAFSDLGNPRKVRIESRGGKGAYSIILIGGDAATSYSATIELQGLYLLKRTVRHGEFPNRSFEETTYKYNTEWE